MRVLVLAAALLSLLAAPAVAGDRGDVMDEVQEIIRSRVEAEQRGLGALEGTTASRSVAQFYRQRGFVPAWVDRDGVRPPAKALARALDAAPRHGLRPADYHAAEIDSLLGVLDAADLSALDARRLADVELLCTDAFLLYGYHLLTGRTDPTTVTATWNLERRRADLIAILDEAVSLGTVEPSLAALAPPQPEYRTLQGALQRYRSLAAAGGWPSVPDGPTLTPGDTSPRVAVLRDRLQAGGDLEAEADTSAGADSAEAANAPETYGPALQAAVERFQARHGLDADGAVGPATLRALNVSAQERVRQIEVNLERWRWLPNDLGKRHVLVNIAAYWLRVVEGGTDVLSMRVIAGTPFRQTPVFTGQMSYLVFNPYWHVPHSIATEDKLPDIQKDSTYFARQQFEVFRGWGAGASPVDPSTIDWGTLSKTNFPYRLRQQPGPMNALGRVKFMFPNPHSVYLHDTPTRGLFARAERSFSSGCIRVERPVDLAATLLAGDPRWTRERIENTMTATGPNLAEQTVLLPEKIPVHLLYWTAWADDGTVSFRTDVYQRDDAVHQALHSPAP